VRVRLTNLLRGAGTPRQTAAAFALGVFLSFSPFLGFQVLLGFGLAFAFGLSRAVMFAGLCTNLPWIMLPWYALTTAGAAAVLQTPAATNIRAALNQLFELPLTGPAFWTQALDILAPFLWSFVVGSTAGALVVGAVTFVVVERYLHRMHAERPPALTDANLEPSA
jgi:uncharacterized protein (DUF2062 family)